MPEAGAVDCDILKWWSRRQEMYPILCIMAKDLFAVPASIVSVKQAFSEGNYMLDERRSRMKPSNLEAQMFLKDATKVGDKDQENRWDALLGDDDDFQTGTETDNSSASSQEDDYENLDFDF